MKPDCAILVVEDNNDDVFLLKRALKKAGIPNPLQIVVDGREAVDYLSGNGVYADRGTYPFPALVFLDLKLPYLSGLEVLEWRKTSGIPDTVVIVLTSSNEPGDIAKAYRLGAKSYLVKPPQPDELAQILKT